MNILGLIEKLLNSGDGRGIFINPDFCVRLKTPMAGCYECIDRCPDLSIKITDSDIKILENCSNCNACLYICPNSVFYVKNNISEEQNLISSFEDNYYYFCKKTDACLKTEADKKTVNTIECIYAIEDLDIVSAAKKGRKISIITGDCKSCNLR
jgi:NAD-dependent dihydropyrimidine dehydrogenase PreA subunit